MGVLSQLIIIRNVAAVRSLSAPITLKRAAAAALITSAASYPRLALWMPQPRLLGILWLTLALVSFVLWAFVFAWHHLRVGKQPLATTKNPSSWLIATLAGVALALVLSLFLDPALRKFTPQDYPSTLSAWMAMTLFTLSFDLLFLCFACFDFFLRLFNKRQLAWLLTVMFGVFVMLLKVYQAPAAPPTNVFLILLAIRIFIGFFSVYFYLQGGAFLAGWWWLLVNMRHLFFLHVEHPS